MNDLTQASKLSFLTINRYEHEKHSFFDASNSPRPHFCMAILERGRAVFHDSESGADIEIKPGDVIFVVQGCRYTSEWWGDPSIVYTSIHFSFEHLASFPRGGKFFLQKVDREKLPSALAERYEKMLGSYHDKNRTFSTLECFYSILADVSAHLKFKSTSTDSRIGAAVEYIEQNYDRPISVSELAAHSNMSESRFFPRFREELGVTPIEYINRYRINRARLLLIADGEMPIERVAELTGFESSAYFRRVFKKVTGMSPREYRRSAVEI